jgi:beta-glucanase (GH16 family)
LNENFDGKTINDKLWSDKTWWSGLLNGQTQRYSKDNLILENGILKIKTEKRTGPQYDDPKLPSRDYTTGHLVTYDKWSQAYGYFEARVKLPTARGLWPAFWLMPDRGLAAGTEGWKRENTKDGGMEMDILEHLTEWGPGRTNVAVHWDGYDTDHKQWGTTNIYYGPTQDGWHTWGLLWEPGKLTWFIDGIKKAEFANDRVGTIPAYLILNVQMGSWATKDVDVAALPDYMQVDWVRAWQLKSRLNTRVAATK